MNLSVYYLRCEFQMEASSTRILGRAARKQVTLSTQLKALVLQSSPSKLDPLLLPCYRHFILRISLEIRLRSVAAWI